MAGFPVCSYRQNGRRKIKLDWITALLVLLLVATLLAYFTGVFPYPYGWIVLLVMLGFRLTAKDKNEESNRADP